MRRWTRRHCEDSSFSALSVGSAVASFVERRLSVQRRQTGERTESRVATRRRVENPRLASLLVETRFTTPHCQLYNHCWGPFFHPLLVFLPLPLSLPSLSLLFITSMSPSSSNLADIENAWGIHPRSSLEKHSNPSSFRVVDDRDPRSRSRTLLYDASVYTNGGRPTFGAIGDRRTSHSRLPSAPASSQGTMVSISDFLFPLSPGSSVTVLCLFLRVTRITSSTKPRWKASFVPFACRPISMNHMLAWTPTYRLRPLPITSTHYHVLPISLPPSNPPLSFQARVDLAKHPPRTPKRVGYASRIPSSLVSAIHPRRADRRRFWTVRPSRSSPISPLALRETRTTISLARMVSLILRTHRRIPRNLFSPLAGLLWSPRSIFTLEASD